DVVVAVDGQKIGSTLRISDYIKQHAGRPVAITVQRDGKEQTFTVTPEVPVNDTTPRIGIAWDENYGIVLDAYGKLQGVHPGAVSKSPPVFCRSLTRSAPSPRRSPT